VWANGTRGIHALRGKYKSKVAKLSELSGGKGLKGARRTKKFESKKKQ